jgi:hypothetical protein
MKRALGPSWTADEIAKGKRFGRAWLEFFGREGAGAPVPPPRLDADVAARAALRQEYEARLLGYPNVVGVTDGVRMRRGKPTDEPAIVVLVSRKVPRKSLDKSSILPSHIDGIRLDVVEVGPIEALDSHLPMRAKDAGRVTEQADAGEAVTITAPTVTCVVRPALITRLPTRA